MAGRLDPLKTLTTLEGRFSSRTRDTGVAARLGVALGVAFCLCFLTGLVSHFMQHAPAWLAWPARPSWGYRVTQGVHVVTGVSLVPLLLAKFWAVFPRLFTWPPFRTLGHALERGFVLLLVTAALFQVTTGLANIAGWYPFEFFFTTTHYAVSWLLVGALVVHVAHKWGTTRDALRVPLRDPAGSSLSRRQFLTVSGVTSGLLALVTAGQAVSWLRPLGLLAVRRDDIGPQGLPVNRSATAARVLPRARDPHYRLRVTGAVERELTFDLAQLQELPQASARLPIACVEGWSADATWTGVRLRDLLRRAGAAPDARVRVGSLQRFGRYRQSYVDAPHARDPATLLALRLGDEPLADDHGYPCRLIAPNRPGVLQTKWVCVIEVLR